MYLGISQSQDHMSTVGLQAVKVHVGFDCQGLLGGPGAFCMRFVLAFARSQQARLLFPFPSTHHYSLPQPYTRHILFLQPYFSLLADRDLYSSSLFDIR